MQIKAEEASFDYQNKLQLEKYQSEFYGEALHVESREKPLIPFQPIFSPATEIKLGMRKNLEYGISADASFATNVKSSNSGTIKYHDLSSVILKVSLVIDLWKDLFGKSTQATLGNLEKDALRAKLQKDINEKIFKISIRKFFWSIVANNESLIISNELYKTAQMQAMEAKKRFQNSVAEKDEVARYEALVASRRGSILLLEYQREKLFQQLKLQLPTIKDNLTIGTYNIDQTIDEVLACTRFIGSRKEIPFEFTQYDEIVALLKDVKVNNQKINSLYSDLDLKLYGSVKTAGVDSMLNKNGNYSGKLSDSFNDLKDHNRTGHEIGIKFTIPFGDQKTKSKEVKTFYDEMRIDSAIDKTSAQIKSTHQQLVKSVAILAEVIAAQKINAAQLEIRLGIVKKKYQQARVAVDDLINDQDALLRSELSSIDTKLEILNTIFDYLSIFTETPCTFNRIN